MNGPEIERMTKMLDLYRLTIFSDVVRVERLLSGIARELRSLELSASRDDAVIGGCLTDVSRAIEVCGNERESLQEIEKLTRELRAGLQ
jgi:hypothetical protein